MTSECCIPDLANVFDSFRPRVYVTHIDFAMYEQCFNHLLAPLSDKCFCEQHYLLQTKTACKSGENKIILTANRFH
jgi:hypothetical protein